MQECEAEFDGKGYGHFKTAVGEAVVTELAPYRQEFARLMADTAYLDKLILDGATKANQIAAPTLAKVKEVVGFVI